MRRQAPDLDGLLSNLGSHTYWSLNLSKLLMNLYYKGKINCGKSMLFNDCLISIVKKFLVTVLSLQIQYIPYLLMFKTNRRINPPNKIQLISYWRFSGNKGSKPGLKASKTDATTVNSEGDRTQWAPWSSFKMPLHWKFP